MTIGILAVQGAFEAHARVLARLGLPSRYLRAPRDLDDVTGLVLPGGESTVMLDLCERLGLEAPLRRKLEQVPVLATCAGMILVANEVEGGQRSYQRLDVTVARNAWGRQVESFEGVSDGGREVVFIRAPRIVSSRCTVLDTLGGEPILVRDRNVTAATFHPELTHDTQLHQAVFGGMIAGCGESLAPSPY